MATIRSIPKMQKVARQLAAGGKTIGLVPTMGFLHEGHLSLIRRAAKQADVVITSIFVNPAQFAPHEDLDQYPRDEKGDIRKAGQAGSEYTFIPKVEQVYPPDFQTWVAVEKLTRTLEGASRPTHFRGVTTIVAKLFNICRPDLVVFGQKDFQQAAVLRQMTCDLGYPIKFIVAPTVREKTGLAMSSRNKYLRPEQRCEALCLYHALKAAQALVRAKVTDTGAIEKEMRALIRANSPSAEIDYIAFNDRKTLEPRSEAIKGTICSLAVRIHGIRLIDNIKLT